MTDERINDTLKTLAIGGTKAAPDLFTRDLLQEVYQGKNTV